MNLMTDLAQIMLSRQGGTPTNLAGVLDIVAQRNPSLAPFIEQWQARLAVRENTLSTTAENVLAVPWEPEIVEHEEQTGPEQKLRKLAKRMLIELKALRARNELLANALGACHLCWGENEACVYCSGQGRVGVYLIDPEIFEDVVGPACRQVMQRPPVAKPETINKTINKGDESHAGL